jgi:hypothetical protein
VDAGDPKKLATSEYSLIGVDSAAIKALIAQNKIIAKTISNCTLIPTDSFPMYGGDGLYTHYSQKGNGMWANRVADSVCARNWGPTNKCGVTSVAPFIEGATVSRASSMSHAVFFDGRNWSAFQNAGKSFAIFFTNGKVVRNTTSAELRNRGLRPGVYITRIVVDK